MTAHILAAAPDSYALVELTDTGKHMIWYTKAFEHNQYHFSVDGVLRFLDVDRAHIQVYFPR